jgi:hypothetical protein
LHLLKKERETKLGGEIVIICPLENSLTLILSRQGRGDYNLGGEINSLLHLLKKERENHPGGEKKKFVL